MSLVGPRPLPQRDFERLEEWHKKRYLVMPGITGLWQVSGRSDLDFDDLVRLDFLYLERWSVGLDLLDPAQDDPGRLRAAAARTEFRRRLASRVACPYSTRASPRRRRAQGQPGRHRTGGKPEERGAAGQAGDQRSGTVSGTPLMPRGTPATVASTTAVPAASATRTVGTISSVTIRDRRDGRAAEQAQGGELAPPLRRAHRGRVDQRERGEQRRQPDDHPHAPVLLVVAAFTVARKPSRVSEVTPGWVSA